MRIISGIHKGRKIVAPKQLPVRPTTDRSKEALFNILHHQLDFKELHVLDLFSGTGSISYEFASRGVPHLTAVDQNKQCIAFINKTAQNLNLAITPIQKESLHFLQADSNYYDVIFADPPYDFEETYYGKLIDLALKRLKTEGQLIIEHSAKIKLSELERFVHSRDYGSATFSFFQ